MHMSTGSYWEWLELANDDLFDKCGTPPRIFRPGDIAHARGGIRNALLEYLEELGFQLENAEREAIRTKVLIDRYCVVLDHLHDDLYKVCFLTTFSSQSLDEVDGFARSLLMPIGPLKQDSDLKPIQLVPGWGVRSHSYLFAAPVKRRVGPSAVMKYHPRVYMDEVERIRQFIKQRTEELAKDLEIRKHLKRWRKSSGDVDAKEQKSSYSVQKLTEEQETESESLPYLSSKPITPFDLGYNPLEGSPETGDLSWLLRRSREDMLSRSGSVICSTTKPQRTATFNVIPKPYYAPSLRASLATVTRLIHR